jgi:hypothetical protein
MNAYSPASIFRALGLSILALSVAGDVTCGGPNAAHFDANGDALRAATACVVLGTNCTSTDLPAGATGPGDSAQVTSTYGLNISHWCTGNVESFKGVFYNMTVRQDLVPLFSCPLMACRLVHYWHEVANSIKSTFFTRRSTSRSYGIRPALPT